MAHEIDMSNGQANMAYVGDVPWHGLGQSLTKDATIETWTKEAGFDWSAEVSPIKLITPSGEKTYKGKQAIYRSDTHEELSIVGEDYKIVQPKEVLEFFRDLLGTGMYLETAGVLYGGRRFWALANTNNSVLLNKNDKVNGMLLLSTSLDGTLASAAQFTSVRVVCNNTLRIALDDTSSRVRVTHRQHFDPSKIKSQMGLLDSSWDKFRKSITELSLVKTTDNDAFDNFKQLICGDLKSQEEVSNAQMRTISNLVSLYQNGMGSQSAYGTVWGQLNAVTELVDHHLGRLPSNKFDSANFGAGAKKKDEAFQFFMNKYAGDLLAA